MFLVIVTLEENSELVQVLTHLRLTVQVEFEAWKSSKVVVGQSFTKLTFSFLFISHISNTIQPNKKNKNKYLHIDKM